MTQLPGRGLVEHVAFPTRPAADVDVVAADDPAAAAALIALQHGAELVADAASARAAVTSRRAAATLDAVDVATLRRLAEEVSRAERICARTEVGFRHELTQRVARSADMARHPSSSRRAAAAILDAERELAAPAPPRRRRRFRRVDDTSTLQRTRAEERLRSARRHWATLVGPTADPHDLDAVLRRHDPQLDFATAGSVAPAIRAVQAVQRRAVARWRVAWASLGCADPPAADVRIDDELERLRRAAARPIVFVEPARWLGADQLAALLADLPAGAAVTLVQRRPARAALAS